MYSPINRKIQNVLMFIEHAETPMQVIDKIQAVQPA